MQYESVSATPAPVSQTAPAPLSSESGQMLPLVGVLALLILAAGVVVFWLATATTMATGAQTAADAAALAGEQELINELNAPTTGAGGFISTGSYSVSTVCAKAAALAADDAARIISCQPTTGSGSAPYDLEVAVRSERRLPSAPIDGGGGQAVGYARASDDAGAQASPALIQSPSCDAGLFSGAPFQAHGGSGGFFPVHGAAFTGNCESRLAGALDRLGIAEHIRLAGITGQLEDPPSSPSPVQRLESCGAAAQVGGIAQLPMATLGRFDLTRPVPGQLDVVALSGVGCAPASADTSASAAAPGVADTNANVHLVPWSGGPAAAAVAGFGPVGFGAPSAGQLQDACTIDAVWKTQGLPPKALMVALDTAATESQMGQMLIGSGSYGLFQQSPGANWFEPQISAPPISQEMNPQLAAEMFFAGVQTNAGLDQIYRADPSAPVWALAQDVQHSGAGLASGGAGNYGSSANLTEAADFYNQVTGGQCH